MSLRVATNRDDSHPWTTSRASAARMPSARSTPDATPATSRSAIDTESISRSACSIARPASPASPSVRARPCFTPACRRTRPSPSWNIWSKAMGSARPNASSGSTATPSCGWLARPASTPGMSTTSSWPFPPETREIQLDEMWSFVAKKQKNCDPADPADDHNGDWWDHVAYDAEHRLVLVVVPGARSIENAEEVVTEVHDRTGG